MATYALAERKGCTIATIDGMSASERNHWIAYYKLREERA